MRFFSLLPWTARAVAVAIKRVVAVNFIAGYCSELVV